MNPKALRLLTILVLFSFTALGASAAEHTRKSRKTPGRQGTEQVGKAPRRIVAAFEDPTTPLAELVERERARRNVAR